MAVTVMRRAGSATSQQGRRREHWFSLLLLVLLLWGLLVVIVTLRFLLPRQPKFEPGSLSDFPPRSAPYEIQWAGLKLFIVNTGDELFVLDGRNPQPTWRCRVIWVNFNQRFEDPCSGSKFALNGGYLEGPAQRHLERYAVSVNPYDMLEIDLGKPLMETKFEFMQRCLAGLTNQSIDPDSSPLWGRKADKFCTQVWKAVPSDPITGKR